MAETRIPIEASAGDLRQLAFEYNWDDGFGFPQLIATHPSCDLAVALELFWLAEAATVYLGEARERSYNAEWRSFSQTLAKSILNGHYVVGPSSFGVPLSQVQVRKYRSKGLPEVFLSSVQGVPA